MKVNRPALWISLAVSCIALGVAGAQTVQKQKEKEKRPEFKAVSYIGCRKASWEPEVFSFYGDPPAISGKLEHFEMHLPGRRIFMFMVESSNGARLGLFERVENKSNKKDEDEDVNFRVWEWEGKSADELREKATDTILANKGVLCVGQQVKGLVNSLSPQDRGVVPAPKTALAAFGHALNSFDGQYVRLTVFLLC